jgi:hypothetical protein
MARRGALSDGDRRFPAVAAKRDVLERDIVFDHRGPADDQRGCVIKEDAPARHRRGCRLEHRRAPALQIESESFLLPPQPIGRRCPDGVKALK